MISDNLIKLIESSEGFSATPYQDSVGIWTIGYGFTHTLTGAPVTSDTTPLTETGAVSILNSLLQQYINAVNAMCPNCNQNQKDALTDFAYNLGITSLKNSTLLKLVIANPADAVNIRAEFMKWVYAGGKVLAGLQERRMREADLFFTPVI